MSLKTFRQRTWPKLIRKAQHSTRLRFQKKPSLHLGRRYPQTIMVMTRDRSNVRAIQVHVSKRMVRENPRLARVVLLHELREALFYQRGYSKRQSNLKSQRFEKGDMRRAGFGNRSKMGWLLRGFYRRR